MIILIAILHALPILAIAFLSGTKSAVYTTAGIMLIVAAVTGGKEYFFVDGIAIVTGAISALYLIRKID